jgi:hypothetical protein
MLRYYISTGMEAYDPIYYLGSLFAVVLEALNQVIPFCAGLNVFKMFIQNFAERHDEPRASSESAPSIRTVLELQSFICFFAALMSRPKALFFFRLSRYDIS